MTGWTAIVPAKPWGLAKSRLRLPDPVRHDLSRAFALDVLEVVASSPSIGRVVLVTAEHELRVLAQDDVDRVIIDRPMLTSDPLNDAIGLARSWAVSRAPDAPVVVVPADLAALTVDTLEHALGALGEGPTGFVADEESTGTTLFAAQGADRLRPAYGPGSARTHRSRGVREAIDIDSRVRRDVDTVRDVAAAGLLGLGPRTSAAVARHALTSVDHRPTTVPA